MAEPLTIKLYPKQAQAMNTDATCVLYGGSVGSGKLLILNTFLKTPSGYTTIANVQVGDTVLDKNFTPCSVIAKSDVDYSEQAYKLTFASGAEVIAGENHEWYAVNDCEKALRDEGVITSFGFVRKTSDFTVGNWYIPNFYGGYHSIVSIEPVENTGMQCIQVDSPDNTYLITKHDIPTHNSFLIRAASIIYAIEVPGLNIYVFRKNYADLVANHIHTNGGYLQMLGRMIEDKLVTYNKSEYSFSFINGSRIQLAHLNNDSDILSYQGREIGCAIIDESTQFSAYSIQFIMSRLRLGGLQVPTKWLGKFPRMILATNPGGVSHSWHKERFVDYGTELHQHPPEWGGMKAQFIPALLTDNKVLCDNDPSYADKVRGLSIDSPELVEAMLNGNWDISASNAIVHWKRDIHVVEPFAIPKAWKVIRGYDYGFSAPYSVLYAAISNGEDYIDANGEYQSAPVDSIFIIAEIYGATPDNKGLREQPSEQAKRVKEVDDSFAAIGIKVLPGPADNSIFSKDRGKSIAQFFAEAGVPWVRSDKTAGSRVIGLQIINQMVFNATLDTPEGPYLKSFKTCPYFNKQIPALQVDKNKPEDIDTKQNDHSADCLRYLTLHVNKAVKTKQVVGL